MDYDITKYDRPSVAADIAVFTVRKSSSESYRHLSKPVLSVLLIKRTEEPFDKMLSLPGGFCCRQETIEETAFRKLKEKTGVECPPLSLLCNLSKLGRDPRGWIISCCYWTVIEYTKTAAEKSGEWYEVSLKENDGRYTLVLTGDDGREYVSEVRLNNTNELYNQSAEADIPQNSLAFDHAEIIVNALLKLRSSLEKPYAAFRLLPEKFTLTDLQQIYEAVLDRKLIMANFRRKIAPYVEETGDIEGGAGHRPSKLFTKKQTAAE
ncbi:NUDIX domain-containing protein [uncultured Ruminococcus sp.]|uniref:NUDIX hydrolase n=1 Tax=uncultured Ruminococcus sp. TaxID=165186 RepID=UPI0025EAE30E|nr:NUDIX domain-containing protein [uncultured Ruminococcus sp.]